MALLFIPCRWRSELGIVGPNPWLGILAPRTQRPGAAAQIVINEITSEFGADLASIENR